MDPLQWMGAVRMRVQRAGKNITVCNESPVQSIQNLRLGRRFTLQQDSDPKSALYTTLWMSLSGPATAWAWTQSNISGETWKCASAPIKPDRAWEVKRWEEWQIIAKCWWAKLVASNKKDCKGITAKYVDKGMNTYIMSFLLLIHLRICDNSVFALSLWCMECILMWETN